MEKKKVFMAAVIAGGLCVLISSAAGTVRLFLPGEDVTGNLIYSLVMLAMLLMCHMLPIYISSDKTMEISFVPVVACVVTKGVSLAIVLYAVSSLAVFLEDSDTHKYYSPWVRLPVKEAFNVSNVLVSIWVGGGLYRLIVPQTGQEVITWSVAIAAIVFSSVAILMNLLFFIWYFKLAGQGSFRALFRENIGGILPNIISTIPLGLLIGYMLTQHNGYLWITLFMAPLMLARYSFKLYLDSHTMLMRMVTSLIHAVEAKDPYTRGHSQRVAFISERIAVEMGQRQHFVEEVRMAALLHDTGKIGVDDAILRKAGPLTTEEFDAVKRHPVVGKRIIESIHLSSVVNDAVLYHHKRYDGTGYPETGPASGKLPLAAAILAVADCFDAMTSDRPYRKGMSKEKAYSILREVAGTQLDPKVVEAFLNIAPNLVIEAEDSEDLMMFAL